MRPIVIPLLIVFLGITASAQAQSDTRSYDEEVRRQLASAQLIESLESPLWMIRHRTLKNAIVFTTLYRSRIDLSDAVPHIAKVARSDDNPQNRRLALAALRAIGSSRSSAYLARLDEIGEDEYRTIVAGVLSEYYQESLAGRI